MTEISIPPFLHDLFGSSQRLGVLALILLFGLFVPGLLIVTNPGFFFEVPRWRSALAVLLILDIVAGCIANFTPATSAFYARRPVNRRVFITVHVHIIAIALLLRADLASAIALWVYTILGTSFVNALAGNRLQPVAGAIVLTAGLVSTSLWAATSPTMLVIMQLFLLKLLYAFAVDHYGDVPVGVR